MCICVPAHSCVALSSLFQKLSHASNATIGIVACCKLNDDDPPSTVAPYPSTVASEPSEGNNGSKFICCGMTSDGRRSFNNMISTNDKRTIDISDILANFVNKIMNHSRTICITINVYR